MAAITQTMFQNVFEDVFFDTLAEHIDETGFDIEGIFINTQVIDTIGMSLREVRAIQDLDIKSVVIDLCSANVSFQKRQFSLWARDAKSFFETNFDHSDFIRLFSIDKNYDILLSDIISVDSEPDYLRVIVERDANIDISGRLPARLPSDLLKILLVIAKDALPSCLVVFAARLQEISIDLTPKTIDRAKLKKIKSINSYRDMKGALSFRTSNERIYLGDREHISSNESKYKPLIDREVKKVLNTNLSSRINNRNPMMSSLFDEYIEVYSSISHDADLITLAAIGSNILDALSTNISSSEEDEKLDKRDIDAIRQFLSSHAIFVNSFPIVQEMATDIERAARIFNKINEDTRQLPWYILENLSASEKIFAPSTQKAVKKLSNAINASSHDADTGSQNEGLDALGLSALRGSLHTMGATIIEGASSALDADIESAVEEEARELLSADNISSIENKSANFLLKNYGDMIRLAANMPAYFSWLRPLLDLLRDNM